MAGQAESLTYVGASGARSNCGNDGGDDREGAQDLEPVWVREHRDVEEDCGCEEEVDEEG